MPSRVNLLEGQPERGHRLLEPPWSRLALAEHHERRAEAPVGPRPLERRPLARQFLLRQPKGRHRLLETPRPRLALAKRQERSTEVHLELSPVERRPRLRHLLERQPVVRHRRLETAPFPLRARPEA